MTRGFACVGLIKPKDPANIGGAMRAVSCYGASLFAVQQPRARINAIASNTTKTHRHIPVLVVDDVFDIIPHGCVPIAVDIIEGAYSLPSYVHPDRAFYIFGAEDATLGAKTTNRCRDVVSVPTHFCMNLAATVNVILYDRLVKREFRDGR